jgi:hypothetical protein
MVGIGLVFAAIQEGIYLVHNKRVADGKHEVVDGKKPRMYVP